ncbi:MAG: hypothetical protein H0X37_04140 [Herpetosiphonaceae bacterium]|nr:hypothetical protein [Herpetosiphonaceae bacterium]
MYRRLPMFVVELLALVIIAPAAASPVAAPSCFPTIPGITNCIAGRFNLFWNVNGSLPVFGYPIAPQRVELNPDTQTNYQTQWFERNRFEQHPENVAPYDVLLGRLGAERLQAEGRDWHNEPNTDNPLGGSCQHFDVTNRDVCGAFLTYWLGHGLHDPLLDSYGRSLALFGLPLTGVKSETNPNGDTVLTQWFERGRFEWHPNNPDPYKVELGLLGKEVLPGGQPSMVSGQPSMVSGTYSLQHGNYLRTYVLHVPPSLPVGQSVPLVLVFHGAGGSGKSTEGLTNFSAMADQQGFVVAYPDGVGHVWRAKPETTPEDLAVDDLGFTSALIDQLSQAFQIDPNRIFASGISNGAGFSYRLACEMSSRISAIGPVAGAITGTEAAQCHPDHPVAVIDFHGTADPIINYNGGVPSIGKSSAPLLSTPDTVALWRQIDGCPATVQNQAQPHLDPADTTSVDEQSDGPCLAGTAVNAYAIIGGGHTWPGGPQYAPVSSIGKTTHDINATSLIWSFFASHHRS